MDELLRFLPFIVGILYFVFGRGKKKEQSPNKPRKRNTPNTSTTSLEDILKELSGEFSPKAKPQPVAAPAPVQIEPEPNKYQTYSELKNKKSSLTAAHDNHEAHQEQTIESIRDAINQDTNRGNDDELDFEFNIRQAIISEAILNRPYD